MERLTGLITADDAWAQMVLKMVAEHVDATDRMRALGFCVSIDHARFMAGVFQRAGVRAKAVWADTSEDERREALRDLSREADQRAVLRRSVQRGCGPAGRGHVAPSAPH